MHLYWMMFFLFSKCSCIFAYLNKILRQLRGELCDCLLYTVYPLSTWTFLRKKRRAEHSVLEILRCCHLSAFPWNLQPRTWINTCPTHSLSGSAFFFVRKFSLRFKWNCLLGCTDHKKFCDEPWRQRKRMYLWKQSDYGTLWKYLYCFPKHPVVFMNLWF